MGCNCGGTSSANASSASSMSSFTASTNAGYIVYRPDGSTVTVDSETAARMEVSKSGGSYRKA